MILSHTHKVIFVHPGKTGGTSIEKTLAPLLGLRFDETWLSDEVLPGENCKHIAASRLKEIVADEIWDGYFTFGFVRNPFDRLLSEWCMHEQADPDVPWRKRDWTAYPNFEAFLDGIVRGEVILDRDYQSWMLGDGAGNVLVDFVGRFERLQEDFDEVCRRIGLRPVPLGREAATRHKPWRDHYDATRLRAVYRSCAGDCERFGYEAPRPALGVRPSFR
ncbi:MAG: sulfotransferase family 2 domain-containing protein [Candidatus Eisenbacteria bacterium]